MPTTTAAAPGPYAGLDTTFLIDVYAAGPTRLRQALDGLSEADLSARPLPGKWSIKEIAAHVADSELIGAARIRQAYTESDRRFAYYDQDVWAGLFAYQQFDAARLELALRQFEVLRATTLPVFREAAPEDWRRTGLHPERGELTLRQLLELYADHSERHVGQILDRRALLGKPSALTLLLPERLY